MSKLVTFVVNNQPHASINVYIFRKDLYHVELYLFRSCPVDFIVTVKINFSI